MRSEFWSLIGTAIVLAVVVPGSAEAVFESGSDGSDGPFNPTVNVTIDLAQAGGGAGTGTYDAEQWVVVFNYTTIDIPDGVTVTFTNHPSGAPVVWLATGDATIAGTVDVSGVADGGPPGPGGFPGGTPTISRHGFGPGGGGITGSQECGGSYGSRGDGGNSGPIYGHASLLPLIGGSGGACDINPSLRGGSGGGAILIASSGEITLPGTGAILAVGGSSTAGAGGGSGGGIRLVSNAVTGSGLLNHDGGLSQLTGGLGRIRVEAPVIDLPLIPSPTITFDDPGLVLPDETAPRLRIAYVNGEDFPPDPVAGINSVELTMVSAGPVTVIIEASYVPAGTTVDVILQEKGGSTRTTVTSTPLDGGPLSYATAEVTFPDLLSTEVFLKANWTP